MITGYDEEDKMPTAVEGKAYKWSSERNQWESIDGKDIVRPSSSVTSPVDGMVSRQDGLSEEWRNFKWFEKRAKVAKAAIEDFNDDAEERAIAWAYDEIKWLRTKIKIMGWADK